MRSRSLQRSRRGCTTCSCLRWSNNGQPQSRKVTASIPAQTRKTHNGEAACRVRCDAKTLRSSNVAKKLQSSGSVIQPTLEWEDWDQNFRETPVRKFPKFLPRTFFWPRYNRRGYPRPRNPEFRVPAQISESREREIERRIRGADGARAGQRQGDVPFDVRRPGADGRPDPATDHIGRAEPLRKEKYYGAQRVPQSRRVEKREFQGLGAGKAQVCKVLSTIKTAASRTDWSRNFARGSSIKKKLRRRN